MSPRLVTEYMSLPDWTVRARSQVKVKSVSMAQAMGGHLDFPTGGETEGRRQGRRRGLDFACVVLFETPATQLTDRAEQSFGTGWLVPKGEAESGDVLEEVCILTLGAVCNGQRGHVDRRRREGARWTAA